MWSAFMAPAGFKAFCTHTVAFPAAISLHITSLSKAINVTTGVTRTFPHKLDSMNPTATRAQGSGRGRN